jgi:hypothetical protein
VTSLVGASAAPNHTAAVKPQMTPRPCSESRRFACLSTIVANVSTPLVQKDEKRRAGDGYEERNKKLSVGENCGGCFAYLHPAPSRESEPLV